MLLIFTLLYYGHNYLLSTKFCLFLFEQLEVFVCVKNVSNFSENSTWSWKKVYSLIQDSYVILTKCNLLLGGSHILVP